MGTPQDTIVRIGGAAGDGVQSTGTVLARSFSRLGFHVHAYNSYQSVIRGGHVWFNIRASSDPVASTGDVIDVLVAIDRLSAEVHAPLLREGGVLIHDADAFDLEGIDLPDGVTELAIPSKAIAKDLGSPLMANTVALGAISHVVGLDQEAVERTIKDRFGSKGEKILELNHQALVAGAEKASSLEPIQEHGSIGDPRPLMTGNEAIALGAVAGGLGYYAAYPMTPASGILHHLAQVGPDNGVVVKQMEDELAVMNSTLGAAYAGARAMCGTSGGGFALMTEAIGMAGMAELGLVVVNSMRGGPSTGLPTKTEQADLWQMMGAGQGDFPRVLMAPHDAADAYRATVEALDIADRFQLPVLLASDFYLSETLFTVDKEDLPAVTAIDRGAVHTEADGEFLRYKLTEDGVSARSIPGTPGLMFVAPSDEHDQDATLISDVRAGLPESLPIRVDQVDKRARKLDTLLATLPAPEVDGEDGPVLVCWGSTTPILREARAILAEEGMATRQLDLRYIHPFHSDEVKQALQGEDAVFVEMSQSGQLEDYVRMRTGIVAKGHVRRYDGELFTPGWLAARIKEVLA